MPLDILKITKQNRRWYEIILWWEVRRIPFNVILYFVALASFYIGYVTLPLLYIIIALLINIGYTLCAFIEIILIQSMDGSIKMKYPARAFFVVLGLSAAFVVAFALYLSR